MMAGSPLPHAADRALLGTPEIQTNTKQKNRKDQTKKTNPLFYHVEAHIDFQQMSASVLEKIDYVDPAN